MNSKFKRFISDKRGVAAIEFSFIMPVLLLLYFGLVDLTAMISMNRKVTYAASVVADLVTQNDSTVTATAITDYWNAAEMVMKPTPMSAKQRSSTPSETARSSRGSTLICTASTTSRTKSFRILSAWT